MKAFPPFSLPGFTPDPDNPHAGMLVDDSGQPVHVFLKRPRTAERQANESAILKLIHQQTEEPPAPHVIAEYAEGDDLLTAFSYEDGVNLADLLTPSPEAPPRAPWYIPTGIPEPPSPSALLPLLTETGHAVRQLHNIRLEQFGKLTAFEPNPFRTDARAYTQQEFHHRVNVALEKGILPPISAQAAQDWFSSAVICLPPGESPCLVHYDLHAGNIRVFREPVNGVWHLRALYDFELARAWLPEWDLAPLYWDLSCQEGDTGQAWQGFLQGYGPVVPSRLRLFEVLTAMAIISLADRYPVWAAWAMNKLKSFL
jgi:aminoglycoside phosphotransferase (APT) family kinase protein